MTNPPITVPPLGPLIASLAIVGEAPGADEEVYRKPFIGASGELLKTLLKESNLDFKDCYVTNVFKIRPPENNIGHFFGPKKLSGNLPYPPLTSGKYLLPSNEHFLLSLQEELRSLPNLTLILALGNTALWALTGVSGIARLRGVLRQSPTLPCPVLPTYHPAAVLRTYSLRSIIAADLLKAHSYLTNSISLPETTHTLRLTPSITDLPLLFEEASSAPILALDTETRGPWIYLFGVATSPRTAFTIPFFDPATFQPYWSTSEEEALALKFMKEICLLPNPKVFQNGLYDIQRLYNPYGFIVRNYLHDTMVLHHSLQPELPKGLGFLGATYLNQSAWKELGKKSNKKDD